MRTRTRWGFYKPKGGLLPFRDDNGFNEWYYGERDIHGELRLWVLVYKLEDRVYKYSVNTYGEYKECGDYHGSETTLRKAMMKATEITKSFVF